MWVVNLAQWQCITGECPCTSYFDEGSIWNLELSSSDIIIIMFVSSAQVFPATRPLARFEEFVCVCQVSVSRDSPIEKYQDVSITCSPDLNF